MKKVLVVGMGKVGSLVAYLLNRRFEVTGLDKTKPHYEMDYSFKVINGNVEDGLEMQKIVKDFDAVVSALPYFLNQNIAKICHDSSVHYFDLTEDVKTTGYIRELAKSAESVMVPQCGLAPGFIGIVGSHMSKHFTKLRDIELRVGALPKYPNGQLAYSFTWSPAGVINEYLNDAEVIQNGKRKMAASLSGLENINIEGREFEAFLTSGGLGTMCETFEGKLDTLNYKTIRYPGHMRLMRFLMYELIMKNDKKLLEKILFNAKPPVKEDVVYVYAVVEGWRDDSIERNEFFRGYNPVEIDGKKWRAISWTTAASIASVVELVADGKLPQKGFIKQEEIGYEDFLSTENGQFFKNYN